MKRLPAQSRTARPRRRPRHAPAPDPHPRHRIEPLEPRLLLATTPAAIDVPDVPGAFARFYNNTTLSGDPVATRVDPNIDFDFGTSSPAPGVNADGFSVRWSGRLRVPVSGYYTFITSADDSASLCVNGIMVVTDPGPHSAFDRDADRSISLSAAEDYAFEFDVHDASGPAAAHLRWLRPGGPGGPAVVEETVPASAFVGARRNSLQWAPYGVRASSIGPTRATIEFFNSKGGADSFYVEFIPGLAGAGTTLFTTGPEAGPLDVSGLLPNTGYVALVWPTNAEYGGGTGAATARFYTPADDVLYEPERREVNGPAGATRVQFTDRAYNETGYVILRASQASNWEPVDIGRVPATAPGHAGGVLSFVDTTTRPNEFYRYSAYATGEGARRSFTAFLGDSTPLVGGPQRRRRHQRPGQRLRQIAARHPAVQPSGPGFSGAGSCSRADRGRRAISTPDAVRQRGRRRRGRRRHHRPRLHRHARRLRGCHRHRPLRRRQRLRRRGAGFRAHRGRADVRRRRDVKTDRRPDRRGHGAGGRRIVEPCAQRRAGRDDHRVHRSRHHRGQRQRG